MTSATTNIRQKPHPENEDWLVRYFLGPDADPGATGKQQQLIREKQKLGDSNVFLQQSLLQEVKVFLRQQPSHLSQVQVENIL